MPTNQAHRIGDPIKPRAGLPAHVPALRLGSLQLRELLSRHLKKANTLLDEWDRDLPRSTRRQDPRIPSISGWVVADIVLINPRFELSFWGLEHCMRLFGKRANLPVACLALLAALVPDRHQVTLLDENVEDIDFERLGRADLVCLTGMSIQGRRLIEILEECQSAWRDDRCRRANGHRRTRGARRFCGCHLHRRSGQHLARVFARMGAGLSQDTLRTARKNRLNIVAASARRAAEVGSLHVRQLADFSWLSLHVRVLRHHCHVRKASRLKTSEQVLAELEAFRRAGLGIIFVVDDNLIGNKKAIKPVLREIVRWQQERAYPLTLFTEASLDLAEDEELMELMGLANFQSVFIGIETPNEDSLRETKKHQNVRPSAGTLLERVHRVQQHGIDVWCGMIVGFDHDDVSIFDVMPKFLAEARISAALIGMLYAIPTTPLYDRLREAGRLNDAEASETYGTNVVPLGMSPEELRDGFVRVMQACYSTDQYFERLDAQFLDENFKFTLHALPYWQSRRWAWLKRSALNYVKFAAVAAQLLRLDDAALRARYRQQLLRILRARWREPHILFIYALKVSFHYHFAAIARALRQVSEAKGAMPAAGRSFSRVKRRIEGQAAA